MAKQGERYNPKTKTGWKYENGKTVYYKKGKILNNRQQLLSLGKDIVAPLVSGAQVIRDRLKISPLSETGETAFEYKDRTGAYKKEQFLDVQPRTWSDPYGEKSTKPSSIEKIENIPPEKKINYVQTPSPTWGVEQKSKPNLAQTPSPTWSIDQERAEWLHETRNSPAARAGMSDDMRWAARQNHQRFKEENRSSKEARRKRRDERVKKKRNPLKINSRY